ncbi:MAG: S4 domain-containing protein [Pyrinomonadaceae bacterium]
MRLDLFLKSSRLCSRRTVAQKMCEARLVSVNDNPAKSSTTVKPGDEVLIRRRDRLTRVRVLALPTSRQTSRGEAGTLYEVLSEDKLATD